MSEHEAKQRQPLVETTRDRVDRLQLSVDHMTEVVAQWVDENQRLQHEVSLVKDGLTNLASWNLTVGRRLDAITGLIDVLGKNVDALMGEEEEECQNLKIGGTD